MALALAALPLLFDDFWIFDSFWIGVFAQGMALSIVFLSFTMVTGEGGLISLCQVTLAGIGAFGAARLASEAGWPVWLAILAGAVIAVPFGLLVALPSLRIGDLYLALLTLGFALLVEQLVWIRPEYDNFGAGVILDRPFGLEVGDRVEMYAIVVGGVRGRGAGDREPQTRDVGAGVRVDPLERTGVDDDRHQHRARQADPVRHQRVRRRTRRRALLVGVGQRHTAVVQRARSASYGSPSSSPGESGLWWARCSPG